VNKQRNFCRVYLHHLIGLGSSSVVKENSAKIIATVLSQGVFMYKEIWKKLRFSTNIISVYYKKTIIEVIGNNTIRYIAFAVPIDLSYTIFEIFNVE